MRPPLLQAGSPENIGESGVPCTVATPTLLASSTSQNIGMGMEMGITTGGTNMDQGVRGWIFKTARENMWRVSSHIDLADLMQDGFLIWHRVCIRYPNVTAQKHLMALFKTAFTNHIHDLSKKRSRLDLVAEADLDTPMDVMLEGEDPTSDPDLAFIIKQLPPALMRVLSRMIESNSPYRVRLDHTRETTNERLCRFAGLDPTKRNIQAAILQYLAGARLHPQYD